MPEQEKRVKTIEGLKEIRSHFRAMAGIASSNQARAGHIESARIIDDAITMLEMQEALKPVPSDRYVRTEPVTFDYKCVVCNAGLVRHWVCCPCCGQAVKWE